MGDTMSFLDKLIGEDELADLINDGARDRNKATSHKYLETIAKFKNLEDGLGNMIVIKFGDIDEVDESNWNDIIKDIQEDDQRSQIEELLSTLRDDE